MPETTRARPRRRSRALAIALASPLGFAALLWLLVSVLRGGPAPRLDALEDQPILRSPIPSTGLGRRTQQSQSGLGFGPDSAAVVVAAYQVDADPETARAAWEDQYGDSYDLRRASNPVDITLTGSSDDVSVTVTVSDEVHDFHADSGFRDPDAGSTVVTVELSAG
jgi:hypothetical protein